MADKYSSTLLAQTNEPAEVQKADLDLLKKINEVNSTLSDAETAAVASLQAQIDAIKKGSFVPGQWLPYPAGTYVFPSGNQTVAVGLLPIGAGTTAPTFGTGATKMAWYKDNGNKTIDIRVDIYQASATGSSAGSGTYLIPLPLGYNIDSSICTIAASAADASSIGTIRGVAIGASTNYAAFACLTFSTTLMILAGPTTNSTGAAGVISWDSASFASTTAKLNITGTISGIPTT